MCGTEKTPSVRVAGDPHGTAKTTFFSYVGSESVKSIANNYWIIYCIKIYTNLYLYVSLTEILFSGVRPNWSGKFRFKSTLFALARPTSPSLSP